MEHSEAFHFLTILAKSTKLVCKNLKPVATIAAISLIIPSIFFLLLSYSIQFLASDPQLPLWAILAGWVVFLVVFIAILLFVRIATVLTMASSYTGDVFALQETFPIIKSTSGLHLRSSSNVPRLTFLLSILYGNIIAPLAILYPSFTTISIAIVLGVTGFIFLLYSSVVQILAIVVSVIEEDSFGEKAIERAKELVEGKKVHGFLMNVFHILVATIVVLGYWTMIGNKGFTNLTIFELFMVNLLVLWQIMVLAAYTVFYFECKKLRGEEVGSNVKYSILPSLQF